VQHVASPAGVPIELTITFATAFVCSEIKFAIRCMSFEYPRHIPHHRACKRQTQ
ncbi:hypothetical protein RSAG8_01225, partial [Rhizoctonia solani AG-8 WAC10335]